MTHRSAEPVSKSKFKVVPPMVTGVRYSSSLAVGVLVATPLAAAAALTLDGTTAPNLESAWPYAAAKLLVFVAGRATCFTENLLLVFSVGAAKATEARPTSEMLILLKTTMMMI